MHPKQIEATNAPHAIRVLFWGNRCFAPGTPVATPTGQIPIDKLKVGDDVFSLDGDTLVTRKVVRVIISGVETDPKPMIQFVHDNKTTTCTYDHPYRVGDNYVPIYQLVWGSMEASQRLQLELLCEQYGQTLDDQSLWWKQNSGDEAFIGYSWILENNDGWSHSEATQSRGTNMDIKPTEQANGEPHRQQPYQQQGRELGMGDSEGASRSSGKDWDNGKELGREIWSHQTGTRGRDNNIQVPRSKQLNETVSDGTRATQDISSSEGGLHQGYIKREVLEVRQISILPATTVYDIEVEDTHNFFANGINVHNCGKTEWGAMEVARYVLNQHPSKKITLPIDVWCACPSYDAQVETTQKKLLRYIPEDEIEHISYIKSGAINVLKLKNGSTVSFKSYEQGREKFQGAGRRLIWFDEEPPHDIWEEAFVRSEAGVPLDIIMTMTPIKGMTWVYDEIYLSKNSDIFISQATWQDNPWLTPKQIEQMSRGLSTQALQVRQAGQFIQRSGLVCSWFDRHSHITTVPFNPSWDVYVAIDFGFSSPACVLFIGVDYDEHIYIFDGTYATGMTTPDIARYIKSRCQEHGIDLDNVLAIADSAQAESVQQLLLSDISVTPVRKQSGTSQENWDEFRAERMQDMSDRLFVSESLIYHDDDTDMDVNFFTKEAENLKWDTRSGSQMQRWDDACPDHAIDAYSYFLSCRFASPIKKEKKPWEGKIPGTYRKPRQIETDPNYDATQDDGYDATLDEGDMTNGF